jgi:molybdopterin-biosynthesis enzyme MoeA-like protein
MSTNPSPNTVPSKPSVGILIIGDEILSGKRADKHLGKCIELLAARGMVLDWAEYVGDSPDRITATLKRAFDGARAHGDVVFSTGGIGATPDDHTRQCAARALGQELVLHPQAAAFIYERMQDIAKENGKPYEPDRDDNIHRLNMGVFPASAQIIPNPYNKIAGFSCFVGKEGAAGQAKTGLHFVPGFPVMAWPMMEWVLDTHYKHLHSSHAAIEKSIIVMGGMEATLTPLMEQLEANFAGVKVFSLPSVDHPQYGRHIELGVKGSVALVEKAYPALIAGLHQFGVVLGPELVR